MRKLGYDVLISQDAGQANQSISDADVLKFAHERKRAVITLNRQDFIDLHKQSKNHNDGLLPEDTIRRTEGIGITAGTVIHVAG